MKTTATRVAGYLLALALVFAGAFGMGHLIGPLGSEPVAPPATPGH